MDAQISAIKEDAFPSNAKQITTSISTFSYRIDEDENI